MRIYIISMKYIYLLNISKYLVIFFPIFLISGPFLTDLFGSLLGIFTIFFILLKKKIELINNKHLHFFVLIFICLNLSSLFSIEPITSFKSSFSYLRLVLFIFAIAYLVNYFSDLPKRLYQVYFICILTLLVDSLLIINFNFNIFGMQIDGSSSRIRSLFDDEEIMGSFISRTVPLILGLTYLFKIKNINKYNLIMIMVAFFLILISGERTALGNFLIFLFFFCILERKFFFRIFLAGLIILLIIFQIKKESIDRAIFHTLNQSNIESGKLIIFSLRHSIHYYTAFEIFKDYPILGAGIKSFRKLCSKNEYFEKFYEKYKQDMKNDGLINGCNTHPHHIYLQFLSETGIINFVLFLSIFIYITYNLFVLLKRSFFQTLDKENKANYFFLVTIFISMFPLLPSGNYFNNWYIFINYFPIGFYLSSLIKK